MKNHVHTTLAACAVLAGTAGASFGLPAFTLTWNYRNGQTVTGVGAINSPFNASSGSEVGGNGFLGAAINNSGTSSVLVNLFAVPGFNYAVLNSSTGLTAFLAAGAEGMDGDPGSVSVPSNNYVYENGYVTSINSAGHIGLSMNLGSSQYASVSPISGLYFDKSALPVQVGDVITAAGVAAGSTFGNFASSSATVKINDNNVVMIAGPIVENGVGKNAIIKVALNSSGALVSETLVAKEGGLVGSGPATWTSISVSPPTCAMNNSGWVIFSGVTSTGVDGIYLNNQFVATKGGVAPGAQSWASLFASPADISNTGQFVFRGALGGNGVWAEVGDAGEGFGNANGGGPAFTAQITAGGGPLNQITGTLTNDQDVDLYEITVGDPNAATQTPFSATTVPNPGAGFAGANFDTVLYLFEYPANINLNTRPGLGRCDDAAPGVMQSTLTTASLASTHTPGKKYILGISTPKARAWATPTYGSPPPTEEMWLPEPSRIAVGSTTGMIFWADASNGQIARSSTTSATLLSPLTVVIPPAQTSELQQTDPNSVLLGDMIAVYDAGANSKVFYYASGYAGTAIRSCNTDGSGIQDIISGTLPTGVPTVYTAQAIAVDSVNQNLYWSGYSQGVSVIGSSGLTGGSQQAVVTLAVADTISAIAIDTKTTAGPGTGTLYWYDATAGAISRSDLTGANIQTVTSVAGVTSLTIDPVGRNLYYATNSGNAIGVIQMDTLAAGTLAAPTGPTGVAFDSSAGNVFWSTPLARTLQRSSASAPSVQSWTSIGTDVGERPAYGPGAFYGFAGFVRNGTAGSSSLPYSIQLTGAYFASSAAMICRNNKINVSGSIAGLAPGSATTPVRISDRGVVAWGPSSNGGLIVNQTAIFTQTQTLTGYTVGAILGGSPALAMSPNGQYLLAHTFYGGFAGGGDNLLKISFASVPGCIADFNGSGAVTVQDIFDFLSAWFAGSPTADINASGSVTVQDIFDFLSAWFTPCTP